MHYRYYLLALLTFSLVATTAQERRVTLIFAGDAMHHTPQLHAAKTDSGYNYKSVFQHIQHKIATADIAGVNLETTFGGPPTQATPLALPQSMQQPYTKQASTYFSLPTTTASIVAQRI